MHRIRTWARAKAHGPIPLKSGSRASTNLNNATPESTGVTERKTDNGGEVVPPTGESEKPVKKKNFFVDFVVSVKHILLASYINLLLVFVPIGIAVHFANLGDGIVFAMNAIAIIPLAGLLSQATEAVASQLGDAIGALMNVTFGNAVELIIFIIALVKDEIRIVQASLLGSILANLLLILGMSFLLGGFRFREQIYNSTVTQMSACLLSLSVTSLLLPTAFHASFNDSALADAKVLQVSRGTSVVLLLVYILYLLFQLNSHSYMYESTPQHIIESESVPWETSSSSSSSDDSSDTDGSGNAATKLKRKIKGKMNRKQSVSTDAAPTSLAEVKAEEAQLGASSTAESSTVSAAPTKQVTRSASLDNMSSTKPAMVDEDGMEAGDELGAEGSPRKHKRKHKKHHQHRNGDNENLSQTQSAPHRQVNFAKTDASNLEAGQRPGLPMRASVFKSMRQNVFTQPLEAPQQTPSATSRPRIQRGTTMPERNGRTVRNVPGSLPPINPIIVNSTPRAKPAEEEEHEPEISRTTAVLLLLGSTALVALCAEFMVNSIEGVVKGGAISETFIGLILLPIVGNAAEHVTGVTVAMKNKMDLSIGVALGSSIQIALFVTPLVVILGWIMNKNMTLFFTLFETVSLFVSAFIVNFLVLDGRSNYLEGALLCAAYIIIAVAAFFYPGENEANELGGGNSNSTNSTESQAIITEVSRLLARGAISLMGS